MNESKSAIQKTVKNLKIISTKDIQKIIFYHFNFYYQLNEERKIPN